MTAGVSNHKRQDNDKGNAVTTGLQLKRGLLSYPVLLNYPVLAMLFAAVLFGVAAGLLSFGAAAQTVGASGNPLPRFVAMSASKANLRTGPGRQYPVDWVYSRRGLPLEIIDEHGAWRKVRDHEGVEGWMLVSLLYGKRTVMIRGKQRELLDEPKLGAQATIIADPGVIGEIDQCQGLWCEIVIKGASGWIERRHVWGVYATEEIG